MGGRASLGGLTQGEHRTHSAVHTAFWCCFLLSVVAGGGMCLSRRRGLPLVLGQRFRRPPGVKPPQAGITPSVFRQLPRKEYARSIHKIEPVSILSMSSSIFFLSNWRNAQGVFLTVHLGKQKTEFQRISELRWSMECDEGRGGCASCQMERIHMTWGCHFMRGCRLTMLKWFLASLFNCEAITALQIPLPLVVHEAYTRVTGYDSAGLAEIIPQLVCEIHCISGADP